MVVTFDLAAAPVLSLSDIVTSVFIIFAGVTVFDADVLLESNPVLVVEALEPLAST